jgi:LysR family transcriptional regulator, transcriptional activator of nhaA
MEGVAAESLNYHHLHYFWMVAREGGVSRAAEKLHVSQPSVSAQVKRLERALGEPLLERSGRTVVLTEAGRVVYRYAEEIFALGRELRETLRGRPSSGMAQLTVGVADAVPKLVVVRLLEPFTAGAESVRITCVEDRPDSLVARLALHEIDVVFSDAPAAPHVRAKVYDHLLGESGISFFAGPELARRLRRRFPRSLDGAPILLPTRESALRRRLEEWLEAAELRPLVVGEFQDPALLEAFGQVGAAVFPGPTAIEREVCRQYRVSVVGRTDAVRERFYAISVERRLKHPAVVAITAGARRDLFSAR